MSDARPMIRRMPQAFKPQVAGDLCMTVQYMIDQPMVVAIERGHCRVREGLATEPDVTLTIRDEYLIKLMTGRMYGLTAFLTGKLKIGGNMVLAQKLQAIFDRKRLV